MKQCANCKSQKKAENCRRCFEEAKNELQHQQQQSQIRLNAIEMLEERLKFAQRRRERLLEELEEILATNGAHRIHNTLQRRIAFERKWEAD